MDLIYNEVEMENSSKVANKIYEYLELTKKIEALEGSLPEKERELSSKYAQSFLKLKNELGGYISKIKQTVETVCSLYKTKVQLSNGKIYVSGIGALALKYDATNAYDVAIKAGNEGIKLLSAIISRANVDVNLREFSVRFNTITEIYARADALKSEAVSLALGSLNNEISSLKQRRGLLFTNPNEFKQLVAQVVKESERLYNKAIINDKLDLVGEFTDQITLPLGFDTCKSGKLGCGGNDDVILSLLDWELHKDGIALIRGAGADICSSALAKVVVNTAMRFLFAYPSSSKRLLLCDSASSDEITTFAGILKNGSVDLFFDNANSKFVKNSDEDIRSAITELNRIINERIMLLGQSRCNDILEYNKKNQDNPQPIILTVINGYPAKYENAGDDIFSALKNGKKAGVFFLVTENTDQDEDSKYYRNRLPNLDGLTKNVMEFKREGGIGYLCKGGARYRSNTCGAGYNISSVLSAFKTTVKSVENKIVYLDSVVDKEDFNSSPRRKKYSKTLSIPIGKQGANPVTVDLNANGIEAHLAVIGTTGSGKTAFVNTFVLSACKLYSPKELELHLIVMVKGDFRIFGEEKLPHLKTVVTGDKIFAANDILDFIDEEMKRRATLIGSYGNIYAYNEVASEPLPRCVIVIDEFYQLVEGSDDAVKRITTIAQVGRAYGISLVISSIRFPMEVNSLIPLFGNRMEFKSDENAGQLIPEAAKRQSELEGAKGLCFFSRGGNMQNVRIAYSEEGERLKGHIAEVRRKYPNHQMNIQSEIKAVDVSREGDVPFTVKNAKMKYDEEGIVRARLGKTYLSNKPLEYAFESKNNVLFLYGHYLETKAIEASIIKDIFVLSKDIDEPTVYYIDLNKNASLKRKSTVIKRLYSDWVEANKMVYTTSEYATDTLDEIKELIESRETDDEVDIFPILVMVTKAENLFEDDDSVDEIRELIDRGKENNVYFVFQCDEPLEVYGFDKDKYMNDAIVFPDRVIDENEYSSDALIKALEALPAGDTEKGKKLIAGASLMPLDPRIHILCDNNKMSLFVPYNKDEEYLRKI